MSSEAFPGSKVPSAQELQQDLGARYEVLEVIGKGGMGVVFKARQAQLDRLVAIKVLAAPAVSGSSQGDSGFEFDRRFEQEAQAMARLSHPHIVAVHDYGETESGIHHIVMEYIDGKDLEHFATAGKLTPEHALVWGRQVCEALAYAHEQGMIHRDIKPSNILIDRQGQAKIADFGLVKVLATNALDTRMAFGSEGYVAPEVFVDPGNSDARVDIYSFGVLLYQMLTGLIPRGVWEPPSKRLPGLDSRFDDIVEKALQTDPQDRYQTINALKRDLDDIAFSAPDGYTEAPALSHKRLCARLALVFAGLFAASSVGSIFNIYFNENQIGAMLEQAGGEEQRFAFHGFIARWNGFAYPIFSLVWAGVVFSLCQLPRESETAKRRVVNLPWWGVAIGGIGWLLSIPGLLIPMSRLEVPPSVWVLLPLSILVSTGIALSMGFLAVDLLCQKLLYPHFFTHQDRPWRVPGAKILSLRGRGILWMLSSSVCPILALLLLLVSTGGDSAFTMTVAALCVAFGLVGVWLFGRSVIQPVQEFRQAANSIEQGNLNVRVETNRADEFGELATEFNRMTAGLREKEQLRERVNRAAGGELAREMFGGDAGPFVWHESVAVLVAGIANLGEVGSPDEAMTLRTRFQFWAEGAIRNQKGIFLMLPGMRALALFLPEKGESPAARAIQAGMQMVEGFGAEGSMAVGIDCGELMIIPGERPDVMGEAADRAFRIHSLALEKQEELLFSQSVVGLAGNSISLRIVPWAEGQDLFAPESK